MFAAKVKGEHKPQSCLFCLPPPPGARFFDAQVANLEKFFETGKAPYPVERTLLTSGLVAAGLASLADGGKRRETPHLAVKYGAPRESTFWRS